MELELELYLGSMLKWFGVRIESELKKSGLKFPVKYCRVVELKYEGNQPFSGRVDKASATEAIDLGSIPGWIKPKTKNW